MDWSKTNYKRKMTDYELIGTDYKRFYRFSINKMDIVVVKVL